MSHSGQLATAHSFAMNAVEPDADTASDTASIDSAVRGAIQPAPIPVQDDGFTGTMKSAVDAPSTLPFPGQYSPGSRSTLHALQEWEGYVLEIRGDEFVARLVDLTAGSSHEEEEATIPVVELSATDAAALREGGIFRWVIGYQFDPSGTKKRVSQIVFRDLRRLTARDVREGHVWARETLQALKL